MALNPFHPSSFVESIPRPLYLSTTPAVTSAAFAILFATGSFAPGAAAYASDSAEQSCTLRIHAEGLRNTKGVVGVLLFRSPDGWPEDVHKSIYEGASPIAHGAQDATVTMESVARGDYGIVVLHDENKNMKLDKNMFGWPKEGFGFANNPHVGIGPPSFRQAVLHVACPVTEATVRIQYK
ncbi:MAG: DUF2141 domain-containing protein [Terracidiphilus sp.]